MATYRLRILDGQSLEANDLSGKALDSLMDALAAAFGDIVVDIEVVQ